jgi:hypothetical protein
MMVSAFRARTLLVRGLAAAALAVAASPAWAGVYELQYQTSSQIGDIYFYAPPPGALPGPISGIVPAGTIVGGALVGPSTETTTGLAPCSPPGTTSGCFVNSGVAQTITGLLLPGTFQNTYGGTNDNQLLSFTNNLGTNPESSNLSDTWFSDSRPYGSPGYNPGGFAFQTADNTWVGVFTYDGGSGPQFWVQSIDVYGNLVDSSGTGTATLTFLAPGPTPGAGHLGLFALGVAFAALKLRERVAR